MGINKKEEMSATKTKREYHNKTIVPISHSFKSPILYLAIGLFLLTQCYTFIILLASQASGGKQTLYEVIAIASAVILVGLAYALNQKIHKNEWTVPFNLTVIIQVLFMLFGLILFTSAVGPFLPEHSQTNQESISNILELQPFTMGLYVAIVAPIIEEMVFREAIPSAFGYSKMSYLVTAIIFTVLHSPAGIIGWLLYGGLSAIFTFARIKGGAVKFSIISHIAWNTMTLMMSLLL